MISTTSEFQGQHKVLEQLNLALAQGKLGGTILLLGQRGLGKTTLATIIARALTCEKNTDPKRLTFCGECYACTSIASGNQPEYVEVRGNTKEITVGRIEEHYQGLRSALSYPTVTSHRIFIIDDAHYLNEETANQLLKLFEEAPVATVFMLITDKPQDLLPTILSRGMKYYLQALGQADLAALLQANAGCNQEAANEAALMSGGRYVDAIALANNIQWRKAVGALAVALSKAHGIGSAANCLADFEFDFLWDKDLRDRNLTHDEATKLIAKKLTDKQKPVWPIRRERKNELSRQALITAFERGSWFALQQHGLPSGFQDAFYLMKQRINQNVSEPLAQAAFEMSLGEGIRD